MRIFFVIMLVAAQSFAADFQAGIGRVKITPPTPFWMSGYASRSNQSVGVVQDLWAKALAIRDPQGQRVVIVTTDLIGLHHSVSDDVFARAKKQLQLDRANLVLCCSHTHSGPVVGLNLNVMFDFTPEDRQRVRDYAAQLTDKLLNVIGDALNDLAPAKLAVGHGTAGFAINRRQRVGDKIKLGVNPTAPVDHDVPVLKITTPDGKLRAVFFGYACHNTTIGGKGEKAADFYKIHGDYAGQAQAELEQAHPGATAMFTILCGGDQNPEPRGSLELARTHGQELAAAVDHVLATELTPVRLPLRAAYRSIQLDFAPHTRETFADEIKQAEAMKKYDSKYRIRRANAMLVTHDQHRPIRQLSYPVQAIRLGHDFTILVLAGEVVVDYQLRAKREFPKTNLMVIGYANDVLSYIPSRRVLREGGYEVVESMIYYGLPGPYAESVEEKIFRAIRHVVHDVAE